MLANEAFRLAESTKELQAQVKFHCAGRRRIILGFTYESMRRIEQIFRLIANDMAESNCRAMRHL